MRHRVWSLLVAGQAFIGLAVLGCSQEAAPKKVASATPALNTTSGGTETAVASAGEAAVTAKELPDGVRAVVLNVPMT